MTMPLKSRLEYYSPHAYMSALDKSGDAYWIEDLVTATDTFAKYDVMNHNEDWLVLSALNSSASGIFVNMKSIVSIRVVTS